MYVAIRDTTDRTFLTPQVLLDSTGPEYINKLNTYGNLYSIQNLCDKGSIWNQWGKKYWVNSVGTICEPGGKQRKTKGIKLKPYFNSYSKEILDESKIYS